MLRSSVEKAEKYAMIHTNSMRNLEHSENYSAELIAKMVDTLIRNRRKKLGGKEKILASLKGIQQEFPPNTPFSVIAIALTSNLLRELITTPAKTPYSHPKLISGLDEFAAGGMLVLGYLGMASGDGMDASYESFSELMKLNSPLVQHLKTRISLGDSTISEGNMDLANDVVREMVFPGSSKRPFPLFSRSLTQPNILNGAVSTVGLYKVVYGVGIKNGFGTSSNG